MMNAWTNSYLGYSLVRLRIAAALLMPLVLFRAIALADSSGEMLFKGPIYLGPTTKKIMLMGQALPATELTSNLNLQSGQYITVYGKKNTQDEFKITQVQAEHSQYVAGASPVIVTGLIAQIDKSQAVARIGNLLVDYAPLLHDGNLKIEKGMFVTISGTQPYPSGALLAESVNRSSTSARISISTKYQATFSDPPQNAASQTPSRVTRIGSMGSGRIASTTPVPIGSMGSGGPLANHPPR